MRLNEARVRAEGEEYWRTHKEGGGTDLEMKHFCDGYLAATRSVATGGMAVALDEVLMAADALADCNDPDGASLGDFNRLQAALAAYYAALIASAVVALVDEHIEERTPHAGTSAGRVGTDIAAPTGSTPVKAPIVRPDADFERWAKKCINWPDTVRALEGAYGEGWLDCEKSHPAATAREEAIRAEVIEECARVCDGIVAARKRHARHGARAGAVTTAVENVAHMIRALAAKSGGGK